MSGIEIVKFLRLLRDTACLDEYWKERINKLLTDIGAPLE